MEAVTTKAKRRPGVPHEALQYIVEQAGGTVEPFMNGRESWVRITLRSKTFEAENNTLALISILSVVH